MLAGQDTALTIAGPSHVGAKSEPHRYKKLKQKRNSRKANSSKRKLKLQKRKKKLLLPALTKI